MCRFEYGYDRNGNRTYRDNLVDTSFGEVYTYDGLDQLASFERGTLNGTKDGLTGAASRSQEWDYDAVGNFDTVTTDGGAAVTRTHNKQNEITNITGATTPVYDANGNLTGDETGQQYVYDAWDRVVEVKDASDVTLVEYEYDGLNRRIEEAAGGATRDLYYSDQWQVIEERVGGNVDTQYVWSPVYVDALVVRDRDTDGDGTLEERLWAQQDANFNTTALTDGTGAVVERYAYDPYGEAAVLTAAWGSRSSSSYDWEYLFQGRPVNNGTGQHDFRHRQYSAGLGRWLQMDPLGFAAGDVNKYTFTGNSPLVFLDPFRLRARKAPGWNDFDIKWSDFLIKVKPGTDLGDADAEIFALIKPSLALITGAEDIDAKGNDCTGWTATVTDRA